jgi:putative ABC transport system substrate-binding protein
MLLALGLLPVAALSVITIARGMPPEARKSSEAAVSQAQEPAQAVIGFLNDLSPDQWGPALSGFRRGLSEAGYVDGENVAFVYRWTEGHRDRLPELAADLARSNVAMIVANGDTAAALAAKAATSKIPILFAVEDDPVKFGLAASLDKPGGNATGIYLADELFGTLGNTRNEMLKQLVPNLGPMFWTIQIFDANSYADLTDPEAALANKLGTIRTNTAPVPPDIKSLLQTDPAAALRKLYERMGPATAPTPVSMVRSLEIISGPFLSAARQKRAVTLATRLEIPVLYHWRTFVEAGGLISHGFEIEDVYEQMGRSAGGILKGSNPAEMPIVRPNKYETVINLRTAADLGLNVPPALLARADKVIQ